MAAIWRHRSENLGTIANDLLGENRFREMVAVAVLLILRPGVTFKMTEGGRTSARINEKLHPNQS
jgi:hypothetical protein